MADNNYDIFLSPEFVNSSEYYDFISDVPDLGFWQLTVKDAAALVVTDIWFAGGISVELSEDDSYDWRDPKLRQALSKQINDFEKQLTTAIDRGSLKTTKILRNLKEEIDTDKTLVRQYDLTCWLDERGHEGSDAFIDYLDEEMDIYSSVICEIYFLRMTRKLQRLLPKNISQSKIDLVRAGIDELRKTVKELTIDNAELLANKRFLEEKLRGTRENHPIKIERPLSTRSRRTLLTIIAALCNQAGINYKDRGAAKRISELTEEIGAVVTDETIRKIISEIDDAVEFRMK